MDKLGRVIGSRLMGQQVRIGSGLATRASGGQLIAMRRSFATKGNRNPVLKISKFGYLVSACGASAVCFVAYKYFDHQSCVYALKSKKVSQVK